MRAAERAAAKASGELHYFTGKPCIRGHVAKRWVSTKSCVECAAEDRRANAEKNREYQNKHYHDNIEVERARRRASYARAKAAGKKYKKNLTPSVARERKLRFLENRPSYYVEYSRAHYLANKQVYRAANRKRRATVRSISGEHHTADDIRRIGVAQRYKCAACGCGIRKSFHADHIVPIARGGSNSADNIQLLCALCNRRKAARDPIEFMQAQGFLV